MENQFIRIVNEIKKDIKLKIDMECDYLLDTFRTQKENTEKVVNELRAKISQAFDLKELKELTK